MNRSVLARFATSVALLSSLLLVACGQSSTAPEDAAITFDAQPQPDLGPPDLGPVPPATGDACSSDADCGELLCILEWSGGYCSAECVADEDCGEGGTCVQLGRQSLCMASCDPSLEDACRAGYGCTDHFSLPPICIEGCEEDADCAEGLLCDPDAGYYGEGGCYDPESEIGDECQTAEQCGLGGYCQGESFSGWPHGYCIGGECDYASGSGCPEGDVCAAAGDGAGLCVDGCATDDDCRVGYACRADATHPDRMSCRPACQSDSECGMGSYVCNAALGTCDSPFGEDDLGDACRRWSCEGGTCLSEFETGYPGAYCAYEGCTVGPDADDGCPQDGVCVEGEKVNVCHASCATDADCRDGYACRAVDDADAARGMGCFPACTSNAVCVNDTATCDTDTGLCDVP